MIPRSRYLAPELRFGTRAISSFTFCGLVGVAAAVALAMALTAHRGLSLGVMSVLVLTSIATFFAVIYVTKLITGEEQIIYYHHEIAVLVVAGLAARLLGAPVRPYLDATILGIGAFLFCGRIGCLLVGCCHGRPSRFGVCYGDEHVARGFTWYYAGIRLFPLQVVEAAWVLGVVIVESLAIRNGAPAGAALAGYVVAYDLARFTLEYFRGDPERPYTFGLSQGQWISFWLTLGVVIAEWRGVLPLRAWHAWTLAILAAAMLLTIVLRRVRGPALADAEHVRELAGIVAGPLPTHQPDAPVSVARTSRGICISATRVAERERSTLVLAFSSTRTPLTTRAAAALASLVLQLRREPAPPRLVRAHAGIYEFAAPEERRRPGG